MIHDYSTVTTVNAFANIGNIALSLTVLCTAKKDFTSSLEVNSEDYLWPKQFELISAKKINSWRT